MRAVPGAGLWFCLDLVTCDGGFEMGFLLPIRYPLGSRIDFMDKRRRTIMPQER